MPYGYYGYYRQIGSLPPPTIDPAVYGLGENWNPIHEKTGIGFRPDYMPLRNEDGAPISVDFSNPWDYICEIPASPREQGQTLIGVQDRSRDTQRTHGRPLDRTSWEAHADTGYPHGIGYTAGLYDLAGSPEAHEPQNAYWYGERWDVERRDQDVTPTERAYAGGANFVPGANSLEHNNVPTDRWDRDQPCDDFGPALRQGVDVIVTVDRDMVQAVEGNLSEGLTRYPHPMLDNVAAVPQAPSQWPDRAMEPVDPYLPGGGLYSDRSRDVIPDATAPDSEQLWGDYVPAATPGYQGVWE